MCHLDELDASETEYNLMQTKEIFLALQDEVTNEQFHYDSSGDFDIDNLLYRTIKCFNKLHYDMNMLCSKINARHFLRLIKR